MMTSIGYHLLEIKEDPSTDIWEKNGKLLTFYMDVAKGFLSISGILRGLGVAKGETDVSTFPGTYSELPG